jgi:hypothetical protein
MLKIPGLLAGLKKENEIQMAPESQKEEDKQLKLF